VSKVAGIVVTEQAVRDPEVGVKMICRFDAGIDGVVERTKALEAWLWKYCPPGFYDSLALRIRDRMEEWREARLVE